MKHLVYLIISVLFFSSCSTYFYSYVQSYENTLQQEENGSYVKSENDIHITYLFSQQNGGFTYVIENRSDDPISIDWDKSILSVQGNAYQYNNSVDFRGTVNLDNYSSTSKGRVSGKMELPKNKLYLPPQTKAKYIPISLSRVFNTGMVPDSCYKKEYIGISAMEAAYFTEKDSPLIFKSHLTIIDEKDKTENILKDVFYISRVIKTKEKNEFLMEDARNKGNIFYIKKINQAFLLKSKNVSLLHYAYV